MCHIASDMSCSGDHPHRTQLESIVCVPVSMDKSGAAGDSQSFGHVLYAGSLSRPLKACRSGTNSVPILLLVQSFLTESWAEGIWEEEAIQLNICMWQNKSSN